MRERSDLRSLPTWLGDYLIEQFTDPKARQAMAKALDDAVGGGMFGKDAWYGVDDASRNLSKVKAAKSAMQPCCGASGRTRLANSHSLTCKRGSTRWCCFRWSRRDVLGHIDDFAYDNITQGNFQAALFS